MKLFYKTVFLVGLFIAPYSFAGCLDPLFACFGVCFKAQQEQRVIQNNTGLTLVFGTKCCAVPESPAVDDQVYTKVFDGESYFVVSAAQRVYVYDVTAGAENRKKMVQYFYGQSDDTTEKRLVQLYRLIRYGHFNLEQLNKIPFEKLTTFIDTLTEKKFESNQIRDWNVKIAALLKVQKLGNTYNEETFLNLSQAIHRQMVPVKPYKFTLKCSNNKPHEPFMLYAITSSGEEVVTNQPMHVLVSNS